MSNIEEIRMRTKKILREGTPSLEQYEEALPLCKELYEAFSETHELWDVHQYVNCLRRLNNLDEAELICEDVYTEYKDKSLSQELNRPFLYIKNLFAWIINDKYVKTIRQPNYQYGGIVLDKLILLEELLTHNECYVHNESKVPSFSYCVLSVMNQLSKTSEFIEYDKSLFIINKIDPSSLSIESPQYTDSTGKMREASSQKEDYYKIKSDFLIKTKQYEECVLCCNEAIETLDCFHYNNDVWFSRKIAMAFAGLGNIDDAIKKLEKLIVVSDKWFLLYEIGKFYSQLKQPDIALEYMLRAVCTKDPEKMKVSLIESIGDILNETGDKSFAQDNFLFARQIRLNNNWLVQDRLNRKITDEREVVFKEIRNKWIHKLYQLTGSKQGKVAKIFPNKTGGFIKAEETYYFQFKNFFGKSDLLKVGDMVEFIAVNSYDRKKQIETEEAAVIIPIRK